MRLLYITDALAIYGGLERVLTQKVNWLVEHGNEICVLTTNQGNHPLCFSLHPKVVFDDLGVFFYRQYSSPIWKRMFVRHKLNRNFRQRIRNKIQEFTPDIILCTKLVYVRSIISVKGDIPFVFESHSSCLCDKFEGDGFFRRLFLWYTKLSLKKATAVVTLTNGDATEWRKYSNNVYVIPNVVYLNIGELSNCSTKSAIFVGRFTKQKDIGSLLKIWSVVHQRNPDWQLNIYGGYGDEQERLLKEINNMDANVIVHNPSSEMFDKYKENSILLLTSTYEPFGLVLPEAMSCGIPVVAFDCPYGPSDIVTDNIDGFIVENRSFDSFSDKVCLLMKDIDMRKKMGQNGALSSRRYHEAQIMPIWNNLFIKLKNNERIK